MDHDALDHTMDKISSQEEKAKHQMLRATGLASTPSLTSTHSLTSNLDLEISTRNHSTNPTATAAANTNATATANS